MSTHDHHTEHGEGHETQDFDFGAAVWFIPISLGILAAFLIVAVIWSTAAASNEMLRKEVTGLDQGIEAVQILRTEEDALLSSYGKDEGGNLRIPVRRAMEILAENQETLTR